VDVVHERRGGEGSALEPAVAEQIALEGVTWDSFQRCTLSAVECFGSESGGAQRPEALARSFDV
jgi:hypothetical protein